MLLTITTTHRPATDLGYLLAKHPDKCQTFSLAHGKAHVFDYIEVFYNRSRRHTHLGGVSPTAFEEASTQAS